MKRLILIAGLLSLLLIGSNGFAITWNGYGVHGGSISISSGQITAVTEDTEGNIPDFHWNKSSWTTRTGQKAFYVTSDLNGKKVGNISTFSWDIVSGYWGNAYFNVMVEDANGYKAILAPSCNNLTDTGWGPSVLPCGVHSPSGNPGTYSIFEAEPGWTGTMYTGWRAATWDEVKDLKISDGPFTEYPDTLAGAATGQDDTVYTLDNWAAWADQAAGADLDWEKGGVMITFGQSTGPGSNPDTTTIENLQFTVLPVVNIDTGEGFMTIQEAIDDSDTASGHTIEVAAGIYNENVNVNKELTIQAEAGDSTIVDGGGSGACFKIYRSGGMNNVTIDGFEIRNAVYGVWTFGAPSSYSDITISNNNIHNHGQNGILVTDATVTGMFINGNSIENSGIGISFDRATVDSLTVERNEIINNNAGLSFFGGIFSNVEVTNCHFEGNAWEDIDLGAWGKGPTFSNVEISGCTFDGGGLGWTAIYVDPTSIYSVSDVHINCNNFSGSWAGIFNENSTTVDAEYNWWDDASGPSGDGSGGGVWVENVDFYPWLESPSSLGDCDSDGVNDTDDHCPGTVTDVPSKRLGTNRWIWDRDGENGWITEAPGGKGPEKDFTMDDTLGCSCEQILAILEEKTALEFDGHYKFGCASSILEDWISGMYYLETVVVPADSEEGVDSQSELMSDVDYLLKATGVANAGGTIDFDAKYSSSFFGDTWTDTVTGYESHGTELLDLFVNGSSVDWGAYNAAHKYWYELAGAGNPVSFYVYDIYYPNNTGSLSVDINVKLW